MRHSYGSYWLAKFQNRAVLAENMGNSIQMIKRHYKRVVGKSECTRYWKITPTYDGARDTLLIEPSADEAATALALELGHTKCQLGIPALPADRETG